MKGAPTSLIDLRILKFLVKQALTTMQLQIQAGCNHAPSRILGLRNRGLDIPCTLIRVLNRDGVEVRTGLYSLTAKDRRIVREWLK
ncbi:helix-turn-helix domain-containing protein [Pseudoduganella sp. OTU4001]|uniref:helix-turn-helix domain-containing protein n=1 Tax=Pseudoduganella sp. OTU4001 TaxID=3043854 RepID=UPI00313D4849